MKAWICKIVSTFISASCSLSLFAQFTTISPVKCDTLTFDTLKIPRLTYIWDGEFEDYKLLDTLQLPRIVEVLYGDSTIRRRIFIQEDNAWWGSFRDRRLWQIGFSLNCNGKGYIFSGDEYDMMVQNEGGKILAEFTKIPKYKLSPPPQRRWKYWRLAPRHGEPVKYARKLLRIYKAQYENVFYHINNCIWRESK